MMGVVVFVSERRRQGVLSAGSECTHPSSSGHHRGRNGRENIRVPEQDGEPWAVPGLCPLYEGQHNFEHRGVAQQRQHEGPPVGPVSSVGGTSGGVTETLPCQQKGRTHVQNSSPAEDPKKDRRIKGILEKVWLLLPSCCNSSHCNKHTKHFYTIQVLYYLKNASW